MRENLAKGIIVCKIADVSEKMCEIKKINHTLVTITQYYAIESEPRSDQKFDFLSLRSISK